MSRLRLFLLFIFLLNSIVFAFNQEFNEGWRWAHFSNTYGLPSNDVALIEETHDGTTWALTSAGLAWYDGFEWNAVDSLQGLPSSLPMFIVEMPDGNLYTAINGNMYYGGKRGFRFTGITGVQGAALFDSVTVGVLTRSSLYRLTDKGLVLFEHVPKMLQGTIYNIWKTRGGNVWINGKGGLYCWDGKSFEIKLQSQLSRFNITSIVEDSLGTGLVSINAPVEKRGLWEWENHGVLKRSLTQMDDYIPSLDISPDGIVIALHQAGEVGIRYKGVWKLLEYTPGEMSRVASFRFSRTGNLWVATGRGLFLYRRSSSRWTIIRHDVPHPSDRIHELIRVSDGSLWVATADGIEIHHNDGTVTVIREINGKQLFSVTGIGEDADKNIWISSGASFDGAYRFDGKRWEYFRIDDSIKELRIHKIKKDRNGRLWFLGIGYEVNFTQNSEPGAFLYDGKKFIRWGTDKGLINGRVYSFSEDSSGDFWFGTFGGLCRWNSGSSTWTYWTTKQGLSANNVFTLAVDKENKVWFGHYMNGAGLGYIDEKDSVHYFTTADGLIDNTVSDLKVDSTNKLWITTKQGLCSYGNEQWSTFNEKCGLPYNRTWPLLVEGKKIFVGTTGAGLAILDLDESASPSPRVLIEKPIVEEKKVLVRWSTFAYWGEISDVDILSRFRVDSGAWSAWGVRKETKLNDMMTGRHIVEVQAKGLFGNFDLQGSRQNFFIALPIDQRPEFYIPVYVLSAFSVLLILLLLYRKRRFDKELRESEDRYRRLVETSPYGFMIHREGKILFANQALVSLLGASRTDELVGKNIYDFLHPDYHEIVSERASQMEKGVTVNPLLEERLIKMDGSVIDVEVTAMPFFYKHHPAVHVMARDITDKKKLEEELRQSQKMQGIGTLAGGIAHDFNNILAIILGYSSALMMRRKEDQEVINSTKSIRAAVQRGANLVRQLLTFARKTNIEKEFVNVNDAINDLTKMLRETFPRTITFNLQLAPDIPLVHADPNQLHQILLNLCLNAKDAMPADGSITISSFLATDNEIMGLTPALRKGMYVGMTVSDTGSGMDEQTLNRIFEPFFTTKDFGKGTGLGLAVVYGIIVAHNGHIHVNSEVGKGTTFYIYMPVGTVKYIAPEIHEAVTIPVPEKPATILVVEDEEMLLNLMISTLSSFGHTVIPARDGEEGLTIYKERNKEISLVLSDVGLPKMDGKKFLRKVKEINPCAKIIAASGYLGPEFHQEMRQIGIVEIIQKPCRSEDLLKKVSDVLKQD